MQITDYTYVQNIAKILLPARTIRKKVRYASKMGKINGIIARHPKPLLDSPFTDVIFPSLFWHLLTFHFSFSHPLTPSDQTPFSSKPNMQSSECTLVWTRTGDHCNAGTRQYGCSWCCNSVWVFWSHLHSWMQIFLRFWSRLLHAFTFNSTCARFQAHTPLEMQLC